MYCVVGGQGGVKMEPGPKDKSNNWNLVHCLQRLDSKIEVFVKEVVDVMTAFLPTGACLENGI